MTDNECKYWVFLSYSQLDNCEKRPDTQDASRLCWGNWLHEALKNFSIPAEFIGQVNGRGEIIPERIHPIYRGEQELPAGASLGEDVRKALEQSTCLVVIRSPRSAKSLHVNEAVRYFKQLGRGKHVLPIVVAGELNASFGTKPGVSPEDECLVPAMRHPVQPDGTIDTTRRAGRYIFVDARHGVDKREILAKDHRNAEADLEMAKVQLIALLIGVGFNGLWWREQRRHFFDFAEAQHQTREALGQVEEVQRQLQEARRQAQDAQNKALEIQNLPRDVHGQIQEAQNQALEARNQAREAQDQLREFQNKVRATQTQLEEALDRTRAAEAGVLEAQNQARDARNQLDEARNQAREAQGVPGQLEEIRHQAEDAQSKLLEAQSQAQEFQSQARSAQSQLEEARNQVREAQGKVEEAQSQAREAVSQLEAARNQAREAQGIPSEYEEIRHQAQDAQNKSLEAQNQVQEFQSQARSAQSQLEEARNQVREAQGKVVEAQDQAREAMNQLEEARNQARETQSVSSQLEEIRHQEREARNKILEAQSQVRSTQSELEEARNQVREAQGKVEEAQNQAREAVNKLQAKQNQSPNARRLTKVFAVLAVLSLMAAGVAVNIALRHSKVARQAMAKAAAEEAGQFELAQGAADQEQISRVLQSIDGAEQDRNRRRSLDKLAAGIPRGEISEALKASSIILDNRQRSHFQTWLLVRMGWVNPLAAMTNAAAIEGKIVNDEGVVDSCIYLQLAVLDNWMKTDLPGAFNWVCQMSDTDARQRALEKIIPALAADNPVTTLARLNELQPVPAGRIYKLLFLRWAASDPLQAIEQRQQIPDHDQDDTILCAIMTAWVNQQPDAALNWVKSPPDSKAKNQALETCIGELAKTDISRAAVLAEFLPEGAWRSLVMARLWMKTDPFAASEWINSLELPAEIMQPQDTPLR